MPGLRRCIAAVAAGALPTQAILNNRIQAKPTRQLCRPHQKQRSVAITGKTAELAHTLAEARFIFARVSLNMQALQKGQR